MQLCSTWSQQHLRQILDAAQRCSLGSWNGGGGELRGLRRQEPLLKQASQDSRVEMVIGDSQPEPLTLPAVEPPAHLGRLLANLSWRRC